MSKNKERLIAQDYTKFSDNHLLQELTGARRASDGLKNSNGHANARNVTGVDLLEAELNKRGISTNITLLG